MKHYITLALGALTLTACVSAEELAQRDHDTCSGYGYQAGTPHHAQCVATEARDRKRAQAQAWAELGDSLSEMSTPRSTMVSTSCHGYGNYVNCTSW